MKISTTNCEQTQKGNIFCCLFEKARTNTKFLLPLILFFGLIQGVFAQGTLQPACNINGPLEGCAKNPSSNTDGDMVIEIDVARSGAGAILVYFIDPLLNSSGAFIRSFGPQIYHPVDDDPNPLVNNANHTTQTLIVYPGGTGAGFNLQLNVENVQSVPHTFCECSKSVSVSELTADSSHTPILCFGGLSTLTAAGHLSDQNGYTYVLWDTVNQLPIGASNTDGIFPNLPGSVAGITYTVQVMSSEGCLEYTSQTITQPADNPVQLNCPPNVSVPACSTLEQVTAAYNAWRDSFSFSGGINPVLTVTPSQAVLPAICGGTVEVRWDVTSNCFPTLSSCSRTFTVEDAPAIVTTCPGNKTLVCGEDASSLFAQWIAGFSFTGGCPNATATNLAQYQIPAAGTPLTIQYSVSDGCHSASCSSTFLIPVCEISKGCTLGFWKTHPQVWDQTTDPVAAAAGFRTSTNFWTFMGIAQGSCNLPNTSLNMLQAVGLNAGGCRAVTRQGVAALLSSAAFGNGYAYPLGTTDFASLKALLVNALSTCNCPQSLIDALNVANNNEYDINGNNICSPLGKLVARADLADQVAIANFDAYPVPFKDKITVKYQFDFKSDVKIEIVNLLGMTIYTQNDTNGYMGKEIDLNLNASVSKDQIYFIKLTTNRGSILKKVVSSK